MVTRAEVEALCRAALDEESHWREGGADERKAAYERFQHLVHAIADLDARSYEEVMNDAIEEWINVHFCSTATATEPAPEWEAAGRAERRE
jgi:hypothetical protein